MASIGFVTMIVCGTALTVLTRPTFDEALNSFLMMLAILLVLASAAAACYEAFPTTHRGQTFAKRGVGIQVVQCDEQGAPTGDMQPPDLRQSVERWMVPHGPGTLVAIVSLLIAIPKIGSYGVYVGVGAGVVVWAAVYASSLLDKNGRGWHDKAAGTIVVVGGELDPVEPGDPNRSAPSGGQDTTKHAPDPAAPEADPQDEKSSYGLVSDYYAPIRERPPPDRDDTQT